MRRDEELWSEDVTILLGPHRTAVARIFVHAPELLSTRRTSHCPIPPLEHFHHPYILGSHALHLELSRVLEVQMLRPPLFVHFQHFYIVTTVYLETLPPYKFRGHESTSDHDLTESGYFLQSKLLFSSFGFSQERLLFFQTK